MKQKSMKSYVTDKLSTFLSDYHEKNFRYKYLYFESQKDIRLAELSQAYFYLLNDKRAHSFKKFTGIEFENKKEFQQSDTKYVLEYTNYLTRKSNMKSLYRKKIMDHITKKNMTMYKVAQMSGTNQSNVSQFFLKLNDSTMSEDKLSKLLILMKNKKDFIL